MQGGLQMYLKAYFLKVLAVNMVNDGINESEIVILKQLLPKL